jgi:hypothetical protein
MVSASSRVTAGAGGGVVVVESSDREGDLRSWPREGNVSLWLRGVVGGNAALVTT